MATAVLNPSRTPGAHDVSNLTLALPTWSGDTAA
jgi:hypothetical protein